MASANKRRRYKVTSSLIGCVHTQDDTRGYKRQSESTGMLDHLNVMGSSSMVKPHTLNASPIRCIRARSRSWDNVFMALSRFVDEYARFWQRPLSELNVFIHELARFLSNSVNH